jgi:hypothetical protein
MQEAPARRRFTILVLRHSFLVIHGNLLLCKKQLRTDIRLMALRAGMHAGSF